MHKHFLLTDAVETESGPSAWNWARLWRHMHGFYTVGSVDIITDYGKKGLLLRLYYPTNSTDIVVSVVYNSGWWHI